MIASTILSIAAAATIATAQTLNCPKPNVVPIYRCNAQGVTTATVQIAQTLGDRSLFVAPSTVSICYTDNAIKLNFLNTKEPYYAVNPAYGHNDNIWEQTVAEAFIVNVPSFDVDPTTYLEFEVSPTNQTYSAFIYNPSKVRTPGTPFDHFFIAARTAAAPVSTESPAATTTNKAQKTWTSDVSLPLALFNVNRPAGTVWRANFFRTTFDGKDQTYGAWNAPNVISFPPSSMFWNSPVLLRTVSMPSLRDRRLFT
ncbi:hypothetical protein BDR26DRAFT_835218 [Obelidium mucronatum]|nr:hypothetical protein BDR26DRAFT_835218 [Obelidium mucronatum]